MKAYKVLGTTDDVTTCELCGKPELKGTVVLAPLDEDGNPDGECYFGVSCAAKAAGWTQREVRAGIKTAKDEERARQQAERDAAWAAEREFLAAWYEERYGTRDLHEAAERAGVSTVRLSGEAIHAYREVQRAAESAPVEEPAEELEVVEESGVEHRETLVRVAGVERVIRTEIGGKVRTTKQLETAHTKAVKAALVEMRRANVEGYKRAADELEARPWFPLKDLDVKRLRNIARRAERGTLHSHGTYDVAAMRKPHPPVRFTDAVPEYLVEVEPGHYATDEAAESLALF
ncbi:hypothetical protein ABZ445_16340 [Streptomyces chartreusis]|uniref:hypothetical protein n=1 Tax=Streptomyces chartreusis TaxID=1969 RepID=UPI0033D5DB62